MKKGVILLTDYYFPNNNANGLCISRIGQAMKKMDYDVHVVAYQSKNQIKEEIIDGVIVHRVKPRFFFWMREYYHNNSDNWRGKLCWHLALTMHRTKKILLMYWYPLTSPIATKRYVNKIEYVAREYNISNIVAGYNPFEAAVACVSLKKKPKKYKVIAYFMDTFTMTANARNSKIIYNRGIYWERKIYDSVDMITNFPLYKKHFETSLYDKYQSKMKYADVPVDFNEIDKKEFPKGYEKREVSFVYTGGLKMGDREPNYLIELFNCINNNASYKLHFFGKGDASNYIEEHSKEDRSIVNHGFVSFDELMIARKTADFMVNIGSKNEVILPSRLLEHIASRKPIIHINYREDDPCISYLEKHPLSLILNINDEFEMNIKKLKDFIVRYNGIIIDKEIIEELYYTNSAEYIAELFDKEFSKQSQ